MDIYYNNKTRILLILEILKDLSDDEHTVKADTIIKRIKDEGLKCDRKTLYDDIRSLSEAGFDIMHVTGSGYKLVSREFDEAEIKLLADAVLASKFISKKKTDKLIEKLRRLTSSYQASSLIRNIYSPDVKSPNEDILYSVDSLSRAINEGKMTEFEYLTWNTDKKLVPKGEKKRVLSPWTLIWADQNYYLLAFDDEAGKMKHFRVDKMRGVKILDQDRKGYDVYSGMDITQYVEKTFSMYGGEGEMISMEFPEDMIGIAIDRFGTDIAIIPGKNGKASVRTKCFVSNMFFGWVAGLGGDVKITAPASICNKYKDFLKKSYENL